MLPITDKGDASRKDPSAGRQPSTPFQTMILPTHTISSGVLVPATGTDCSNSRVRVVQNAWTVQSTMNGHGGWLAGYGMNQAPERLRPFQGSS